MTVFLVGAGPGDPRLITRHGLDLIRTADVLVYDRLVHPALLDEAPPGCRLVDAGKRAGSHTLSQAVINEALVEHGRSGQRVVRLKGGDPFVFGRGGEEALALHEAGVAFEVVPGVTSGVAAPAYAGIPVTHRGLASLVTFVTGHEDPDKDAASVDWDALARLDGTLVVYMTSARLAAITARLINAGLRADTPACVISAGTLPQQRVVEAGLGAIADAAASIPAPALLVTGRVASLRRQLDWAPKRPLHGVSIAITRARDRQSQLRGMLEALGAIVIDAASIRTEPVSGARIDAGDYDVICITSPAAPRYLLDRVGGDARRLAGCLIAALGPGTQQALRDVSLQADIVATEAIQEGLAEALAAHVPGRRVLIAAAQETRTVLADAVRAGGAASVEVVALYRTVSEPARRQEPDGDLVVFTSASTVRHFAAAYPALDLSMIRGVSIGPVTSEEARRRGVGIVAEASVHTLDGLVNAVIDAAGNRT